MNYMIYKKIQMKLNNLYGDIKYKKIQDRLQKRLDSYRIELKVDEY